MLIWHKRTDRLFSEINERTNTCRYANNQNASYYQLRYEY